MRRDSRRGSAFALLVSLGYLSSASCAGRSESRGEGTNGGSSTGAVGGATGGVGAGATGGAMGKAGTCVGPAGGGTGNVSSSGGKGASGGNGATGGLGGADVAGDSGSGGDAGSPFLGCQESTQYSSNLVRCEGGFVHRPSRDIGCPYLEGGSGGGAGEGSNGGEPGVPNECGGCPPGSVCIVDRSGSRDPACVRPCATDGTCQLGEICACLPRQWFPLQKGLRTGACLPATCAVDADCAGGLCLAQLDAIECGILPGTFACQTPRDECAGIGDCDGRRCVHDGDGFVCAEHPTEECQ